MDTFIDFTTHTTVSLIVGYGAWRVFGKRNKKTLKWCLFFSFLAGVLIDLDHLFDYYMAYGTQIRVGDFLSAEMFQVTGKNYIIFHGFEYVALLGVVAHVIRGRKKKLYVTVMALAMFFHLLTDIVLFSIPFQNYIFIYRVLHHFKGWNTKV